MKIKAMFLVIISSFFLLLVLGGEAHPPGNKGKGKGRGKGAAKGDGKNSHWVQKKADEDGLRS